MDLREGSAGQPQSSARQSDTAAGSGRARHIPSPSVPDTPIYDALVRLWLEQGRDVPVCGAGQARVGKDLFGRA